jgi:outer membrane immunogenic protein
MARGGVLVAPNWLVYLTGGVAFGEVRYKFSFSQPGSVVIAAATAYSLSVSDTRAGGAVGVGREFKFAGNWSFKIEYLYIDLGTFSINTTDIDGDPFPVCFRVRDNVIRVGLNYQFATL